mgnify:CR=1 FL=1
MRLNLTNFSFVASCTAGVIPGFFYPSQIAYFAIGSQCSSPFAPFPFVGPVLGAFWPLARAEAAPFPDPAAAGEALFHPK